MKFLRLATAVASLALCLGASAQDKPIKTPIDGQPWQPAAKPKLIYGTDDRIDVYQETDATRLAMAASTCGVFQASNLLNNGDGTYDIALSTYTALGVLACPSEPYGNQPVAAFCSGFMVGDDIIATAGHCLNSSNLSTTRLVFGFVMEDANTPVVTVPASQVYTAVAVLGRQFTNDSDYCIVRVDRPITAPNAAPLEIRRDGSVSVGTPLGVIGHPAGLPMKIAFGPTTAVRSVGPADFFVANTDTYGGNSGSPVFNAETGIVEGILVRGESDYALQGDCFVSYAVADDAGRGEDVSKTVTFAQYVPVPVTKAGTIELDVESIGCGGSVSVVVRDLDLAEVLKLVVSATSSGGDQEYLTLSPLAEKLGEFGATFSIVAGVAHPSNGRIEAGANQTVTFSYLDADNGTGASETKTDSVLLDCTAPVISATQVPSIGSTQAEIRFTTNEPAIGLVRYGTACGDLNLAAGGTQTTSHVILLDSLAQETTYFFSVEATDAAGNVATMNNGGACFQFKTLKQLDYLTKNFETGASALSYRRLNFIPDSSIDAYALCVSGASAYETSPAGGTVLNLGDDSATSLGLNSAKTFSFFGTEYNEVQVCANGFVTFDIPNEDYRQSLEAHFELKRLSALFRDLSPNLRGSVSYVQTSDRLAITFDDVPEYTRVTPAINNSNNFQIELFFDGRIQITYLGISTNSALVGLSRGLGLSTDFVPSELLEYPICLSDDLDRDGLPDLWESAAGLRPDLGSGDDGASGDPDHDGLSNAEEYARGTHPLRKDSDFDGVEDADEVAAGTDPTGAGVSHSADTDLDFRFSIGELLRLIQFYNSNGFHCATGTEDGFAPDDGPMDCVRHHSDYLEPSFDIGLAEILRAIQFYNSLGYGRSVLSEDSFSPIF